MGRGNILFVAEKKNTSFHTAKIGKYYQTTIKNAIIILTKDVFIMLIINKLRCCKKIKILQHLSGFITC